MPHTKNNYEKYWPILKQEIELLQPKRIIVLGTNAYEFLKNKGVKCEKAYHPAYFIYQGKQKESKKYYENIIKKVKGENMELLITLGHNSSAVAVRNGEVIAGYEEERHDRLKSASIFPLQSIIKCIDVAKPKKSEENIIFVSHWFDDFDFQTNNHKKIHEKYWNKEYINFLIKEYGFKVISLSSEFTHHDAHAYAVTGFFEHHKGGTKPAMIMVADGFGNKQEVMSLYKLTYDEMGMRNISLYHRSYGYKNSLGLFYQYATSFTGMTENQDEYKFLGYESHIHEVIDDENYNLLHNLATEFANKKIQGLLESTSPVKCDPEYISLDDLEEVKKENWAELEKVINIVDFFQDSENLIFVL